MLNLKKIVVIAIVATFLAAIPLTIAVSYGELDSVTYTLEIDTRQAKPPGTPGAKIKPSPGYKLTGVRWKTLPLTLNINPGSLDADFVTTAIEDSAEEWDYYTGAELVTTYVVDTSVTLDGPTVDGVNELVFADIADGNIIAQCTYWYTRRTKEIVDFEIVFNTKYVWGDASSDVTKMDLQNIATHELGHGFGLADLYDKQWIELTMYGYANYGETNKRSLEAGDIAGIQAIYGT